MNTANKTAKKNTKAPRKNIRRAKSGQSFSLKSVFRGLKIAFIVSSISALLGVSGYYGTQAVQQFLSRPIASVLVSGQFVFLSKPEITGLISQNIEKSFVRENLDNMRAKLEVDPWVDRVVLRRQWPDTLHVDIVEEKPIARWGDKGFVNHRGELVRIDDSTAIAHLPRLEGDDKQSVRLMKQYQLLSQLLSRYGLKITELKQSTLGVWAVELDNGWQFIAGRNDVARRMQRFMQALAANTIERREDIAVIDMRYENGVAIAWKTAGLEINVKKKSEG